MEAFIILLYYLELNRIKIMFGGLKNRISFQNLNIKDLNLLIIEEIIYEINKKFKFS